MRDVPRFSRRYDWRTAHAGHPWPRAGTDSWNDNVHGPPRPRLFRRRRSAASASSQPADIPTVGGPARPRNERQMNLDRIDSSSINESEDRRFCVAMSRVLAAIGVELSFCNMIRHQTPVPGDLLRRGVLQHCCRLLAWNPQRMRGSAGLRSAAGEERSACQRVSLCLMSILSTFDHERITKHCAR